jgi:formylglycine-generating enzyme
MAYKKIDGLSYPSIADTLTGYGAIDYAYDIDQFAIRASDWAMIVNMTVIDNLGTWTDDQPVAGISWYEAAMFCNWLTTTGAGFNLPAANITQGAYNFGGTNSNPGNFINVDRVAALGIYGTIYVLPKMNEWYRAAYYKADHTGYSLFSTYNLYGDNPPPIDSIAFGSNYGTSLIETSTVWDVNLGCTEQNGTSNMMGNVWEWCEDDIAPGNRRIMGGSFNKPVGEYLTENLSYIPYMTQDTSFINICSRRVAGLAPHTKDSSVGLRIVRYPSSL